MDSVEHLDNGAVDDLVFQGCNSERPKPPIRLRDVRPSGGSCPVLPRRSRACNTRRLSSSRSPYCCQVTPSVTGAASRLIARYASRSLSSVTWCARAVNFAPLSRRAICCTRSSALGTPFRLCVRGVFCCLGFLLALPTASAAGRPALLGSFSAIIWQSDFPGRSSSASGLWPSRRGPTRFSRASRGSPGSHARSLYACQGSPTAPGPAQTRAIVRSVSAFRFA